MLNPMDELPADMDALMQRISDAKINAGSFSVFSEELSLDAAMADFWPQIAAVMEWPGRIYWRQRPTLTRRIDFGTQLAYVRITASGVVLQSPVMISPTSSSGADKGRLSLMYNANALAA